MSEAQERNPVLFIKINCAFRGEQAVDYEALGIDAPNEFQMAPAYLNLTRIEAVWPNTVGGLNIGLGSGEMFSTDPEQTDGIRAVLNALAIKVDELELEDDEDESIP